MVDARDIFAKKTEKVQGAKGEEKPEGGKERADLSRQVAGKVRIIPNAPFPKVIDQKTGDQFQLGNDHGRDRGLPDEAKPPQGFIHPKDRRQAKTTQKAHRGVSIPTK